MTSIGQLEKLAASGIDYAGLIFYKKSPRYVADKMQPDELVPISKMLRLTGVFVNEDPESVKRRVETYHLQNVQLCGTETPAECRELQKYAEVIKVFHIHEKLPESQLLDKFADCCDYFLFDTRSEGYGGTGRKFDWDLISEAAIRVPFFLSGGISDADSPAIQRMASRFADSAGNTRRHFFHAVDINSRFETGPGVKDIQKIKTFISQLK